jgi:hypothetical protein
MKKRKNLKTRKKMARKEIRNLMEMSVNKDKYVPKLEDVITVLKEKEKGAPKVTCGNCGYRWAPQPYLWKADSKNMKIQEHNGETIKPIVCPKCSVINRMDAGILLDILTWWTTHQEICDLFKEEVERVQKKYANGIPAT